VTALSDRSDDDAALVGAAVAGDPAAFARASERHRRELKVHCYRMLGSFDDAEDVVQDALLRAWRGRATYGGHATFRAWLYRIATNACLDFLARRRRRPLERGAARIDHRWEDRPPSLVDWLQPYPDAELNLVAARDEEPEAVAVRNETVELAFIVALQHLPPRQRAAIVLRDVLGWTADETARLMEVSVPAVKSALQRARPAMRRHLPARRSDWASPVSLSDDEHEILRRFMEATERADMPALAALIHADAWQTMPPHDVWFDGRDAMLQMWAAAMSGPTAPGEWRLVATAANGQPAVANYLRPHGSGEYRASNLDVLRVEGGRIAEVTTFSPSIFPAFGLPMTMR